MVSRVYSNKKNYDNLEDLKKSFQKVWDGLEMDLIKKLFNSFPKQLIEVVAVKGGHTDIFGRDKNTENWFNAIFHIRVCQSLNC